MRLFQNFTNLRLAVLLGASTGLASGCIVTLGGDGSSECGGIGSNSEVVGDDCVCDPGYDWCNPTDDEDFSCCQVNEPCVSGDNNMVNAEGNCECNAGYTWCDPTDQDNLDCCEIQTDSGTDETSADGSGTDAGDGDGDTGTDGVLPPDECSAEEEGFYYCTNTAAMGPIGSQTFLCENGMWVEQPNWPQDDCVASDFDFGVGCVFDEDLMEVQSVCEDGPGDACELDSYTPNCFDSDTLYECFYTKVMSTSCLDFCQNEGIDGVTYEMGECGEQDGVTSCLCFDSP